MNDYTVETHGYRCVGMAVVAADTRKQAKDVAASPNAEYAAPDFIELLPCQCEGPARVLGSFEVGSDTSGT